MIDIDKGRGRCPREHAGWRALQMAALASRSEAEGGVSAVITEDSDLLCYDTIQSVLFKVDRCAACRLTRLRDFWEHRRRGDILDARAVGLFVKPPPDGLGGRGAACFSGGCGVESRWGRCPLWPMIYQTPRLLAGWLWYFFVYPNSERIKRDVSWLQQYRDETLIAIVVSSLNLS